MLKSYKWMVWDWISERTYTKSTYGANKSTYGAKNYICTGVLLLALFLLMNRASKV